MQKKVTPLILAFLMLFSIHAFSDNSDKPASNKTFFYRTLLFQWAEDANEETKAEVLNLFKGLPEKVEGFIAIDIVELSKSTQGFHTLMILKFESMEAAKTYEKHPDHKKLQEIAPPLVSQLGVYEYTR